MALIKGPSGSKKAPAKQQQDLQPADGWLNMKVVRSDGSEFALRRGIAIHKEDGGDRVLEALLASETKYRDQCLATGIEYVPRTINIQATVQIVLPQAEIPDLFA